MLGHTGTDDDNVPINMSAPANNLLTNPGLELRACPVELEDNGHNVLLRQ